jgi:hypothetical protein
MSGADLAQTIEAVRVRWAASGLKLRPGVSMRHVADFERRHGVRLPADFVEYVLAVDGMEENTADAALFRFWPLAEISTAEQSLPHSRGLSGCWVFADQSLWAYGYALRLGGGTGDVVVVGSERPIPVAASFGEFLSAYLRDDRSIYG